MVGKSVPPEFRAFVCDEVNGKSYEQVAKDIARDVGMGEINKGVIYKIVNDPDYRPETITRRKLGLLPDPLPRIAIRKDDPESAFNSIVNNIGRAEVEIITGLLVEWISTDAENQG